MSQAQAGRAQQTELQLERFAGHSGSLYALTRDAGDPLFLCLHGFPDTARVWEPLLRALPEDASFLAPFAHGSFHRDRVKPERYALESWCLELLSLLQSRDPEHRRPIILMAHDLGGPYARALVDYLGERCRGLIYINSLGLDQYLSRMRKVQQWLKSYYIGLFQLPFAPEALMRLLHPFSLERIYDLGGVPPHDAMRLEGAQVFNGIAQYRQILKAAPALLARRALGAQGPLNTPALFLWGESDPFLDIPTQTELKQFYTRAEIRVLDANHWVLRTHPETLARYISRFLSHLDSPGGMDAE